MGCDIHLHAEVQIDDRWHHYADIHIHRNYRLFAAMTGDRKPRGLPNDVSTVTLFAFEIWGVDGHSPSWIDSKEIAEVVRWMESIGIARKQDRTPLLGYIFGSTWESFHLFPNERPEGLQDVRFVFWFDGA